MQLLRGPSCPSGRGSALWRGLASARLGPTGLCPPADNHPDGRTHWLAPSAAISRGLRALGGSWSGEAMGGPPAQVCGGSSSEERDFPRWPRKAVSRLQRSQWLPLTVGGPPARGTGETGGRGGVWPSAAPVPRAGSRRGPGPTPTLLLAAAPRLPGEHRPGPLAILRRGAQRPRHPVAGSQAGGGGQNLQN